jgi:hypothetical protein
VILFGPKPQRVEGVPKDAAVTDLSAPSVDSIAAIFSSDEDWDSGFVSTLRLVANVDQVSVLSQYTYAAAGPALRVTATGSGFRRRVAEAAIRQVDRELVLAPLAGVRFRALHRTIESDARRSYLADFTIEGPDRNSFKLLPQPASSLAIIPSKQAPA